MFNQIFYMLITWLLINRSPKNVLNSRENTYMCLMERIEKTQRSS